VYPQPAAKVRYRSRRAWDMFRPPEASSILFPQHPQHP
jgi:hypothetical protein